MRAHQNLKMCVFVNTLIYIYIYIAIHISYNLSFLIATLHGSTSSRLKMLESSVNTVDFKELLTSTYIDDQLDQLFSIVRF